MSSATEASNANDSRDEYREVDFNGVIDTDVLDPFIRHAKELYDEYVVIINSSGFHIRVVEPTNAVMMDARIHRDDFAEYDSRRGGPIGVSHTALEEMIEFVDATNGHAHVSIEDGTLMLSDGDRLFTDTRLIDPDAMRQRPERLAMDIQSSVTVGRENNDMWDLIKFIRSNSSHTAVNMEVNHDRLTLTVGDDEDDSIEVYGDAHGCDVEQSYSTDMLYKAFKKPLKTQLTDVPYTFSFMEQNSENDIRVMTVSREYDSDSKLTFTVAPRIK